MRRILAYILALSIFGTSVHADEFLKAPQLMKHYSVHKAANEELSVIAFLYDHYILQSHAFNSGEKKQHDKLPFHSSHQFLQHQVTVVDNHPVFNYFTFSNNIFFKTNYCNPPEKRPADIWQPPQLV